MANAHQEEKKSFSDKLAEFIEIHKKTLIIVVIVVVVAVAAVGIGTYVVSSNFEKAVAEVELAQEQYAELSSLEQDSREYTAQLAEVRQKLTDIRDSNKDNYPHMKATYLLGLLTAGEGEYTQAAELFGEVASKYADTHLGAPAVMSQAAALEMAGEFDQAIGRYQYLIDNFSDVSPDVSHAYFSIARLYEMTDRTELAVTVYQQLEAEFPESEWTKLARTRLIQIQ
jgi:tetratricopeptide (TPR) repeat protein